MPTVVAGPWADPHSTGTGQNWSSEEGGTLFTHYATGGNPDAWDGRNAQVQSTPTGTQRYQSGELDGVPAGATITGILLEYDFQCTDGSAISTLTPSLMDTADTSVLKSVWKIQDQVRTSWELPEGSWGSGSIEWHNLTIASDYYFWLHWHVSLDSATTWTIGWDNVQITYTYTLPQPTWVSPADTAAAAAGDALVWTSISSASKARFQLQVASDSGFSSGLVTYDSDSDSGFEYWDGSAWQTLNSARMPVDKTGNDVRFTATSGFSGTKYRRVRQMTV
jgi:hypothetical protein